MTAEETNKFFLDTLNYATEKLMADSSMPPTAVIMTASGKYRACSLPFTNTRGKAAVIDAFVSELKELKPRCAIVIVPMTASAGRGRKRTTSLCVAFQSSQRKFVSIVNYEKNKSGECRFDQPYFCNDNEIILSGHEYFGDAFCNL